MTYIISADQWRELNAKHGKRKYRNIPTELDGIRFDSRKESLRWRELCILQSQGRIKGLQRQVRFPIIVNGQKICVYVADFCYQENGLRIIEDVKSKGTITDVYRLKNKLMKATLGITIKET